MNFFHTHISEKSKKLVQETLESTFLSEGKLVKKFESELKNKLNLLNPVTVNSGTTALHLALVTASIGPGDEVILPPQTFVASGIVILMQGAKPIFADIQKDTGNIDPESIKKKITNKTKAIMPVHWGGYPCDMDEISTIAKKSNLIVIEDAAHALGATYKKKFIGSISEYSCFSFQAIKHLTTGDGGALAIKDPDKAQIAKTLTWFGIDRLNSKPTNLGEREYDISKFGYKYHMNDYSAALGLGNIEDLPSIIEARKKIANYYRQKLKNIPGLTLLNYQDDRESSNWLFTILVEERDNFINKMQEFNIPVSVVHLGIDKNSVFGGKKQDLTNQRFFDDHQISIPVHSGLTFMDVELIVKTIKSGW